MTSFASASTSGTAASTPVEQFCLGFAYWRGNLGFPRDPARAAQLFAQAAQKGHLGAQTLLGYHYEQGHGVPRNVEEAVKWFTKAADVGYATAMFHLGRLSTTGKGVSQNQATADKWFRKAADAGSSDAIIALRKAREYELDQPARQTFEQAYRAYEAKDYPKAATLYRSAAEAGNAGAQSSLGTMLRVGQGVPKNTKEAAEWYRKAKQGSSQAIAQLGFAFEMGEGVSEDWTAAAKACMKSASEFNRLGLYCLGRQYQFGIGVPQNRQKAVYYFDRANDFGDGQSAWFARWLRVDTNCIGYRNEAERVRYLGVCGDPKAVTFSSSKEYYEWLNQKLAELEAQAAALRRSMDDYGKGACGAAGGSWGGGGCMGDGGRTFDPGQQDRYGRSLW